MSPERTPEERRAGARGGAVVGAFGVALATISVHYAPTLEGLRLVLCYATMALGLAGVLLGGLITLTYTDRGDPDES